MTGDRDTAAADWCVSLAGDDPLDVADQAAFDQWIEDPANADAFREAMVAWHAVGEIAHAPELLRLRGDALANYRSANRHRWRAVPGRRWLAVAAALVLAIGVSFFLINRPSSYETGVGERQVAMLADGSRLVLDGDTLVEVRLRGDRRELTLRRGRARFDVAKDPLRPFTVASEGRTVVATGTSFSVEQLPGQTRVVLYEGHVAVLSEGASPRSGAQAGAPITALRQGQELILRAAAPAATGRIVAVDAGTESAWEMGQISFDDEPLTDAVARINRYGPVRLVLQGQGFDAMRVNGVFKAGDLASFVEGMTMLHPLVATPSGDRVVLRPRSIEKPSES